MLKSRWCVAAAALVLGAASANAQDVYKIGMSAGLTGYAATVDRAWRDGVEVAIAALNAKSALPARRSNLWWRIIAPSRRKPSRSIGK